MLELFDGNWYLEDDPVDNKVATAPPFSRNNFQKSTMVFSLASFDFKKTKEELFAANRMMRTIPQLKEDVDSLKKKLAYAEHKTYVDDRTVFNFFKRENWYTPDEVNVLKLQYDSLRLKKSQDTTEVQKLEKEFAQRVIMRDRMLKEFENSKIEVSADQKKQAINSVYANIKKSGKTEDVFTRALNHTRSLQRKYGSEWWNIYQINRNKNKYNMEKYKKLSMAFSCMVMFLIGAPLGAIIKRGGLGVPTLISIVFFIIFYVIMIWGEKWAKDDILEPLPGVWLSNAVLFPVGLFFLRQARNDVRIFESDYYAVLFGQLKKKIQGFIKNNKEYY
jgi:lipopolysaccharide export system permease protein